MLTPWQPGCQRAADRSARSPVWTEDDVFLAVLPFFHIYGLTGILSTQLARGATLVTLPRFDLEHVLSTIQDYHVTVAHLVPPIVLPAGPPPARRAATISARCARSARAARRSAPRCCARWRHGWAASIIQGYGMTELSCAATGTTDDLDEVASGTVGWLLPNMALESRRCGDRARHSRPAHRARSACADRM